MEKFIPDTSLLDDTVLWLKFFLTGATKNNHDFEWRFWAGSMESSGGATLTVWLPLKEDASGLAALLLYK